MPRKPKKKSASDREPAGFAKVAECLYRHTSSGTYYALLKRAGKQYRKSLKVKDRRLAERKLADFRSNVDRLDHSRTRPNLTFAECAEQWLGTVTPHMKPSSAKRRVNSVAQIAPRLGNVLIRQITATTCEAWAAKRGAGIAASTYNNERDTIIAILEYAKREGLLLDNPALVLPRRKLGRSKIVIPSKEEFEKLVATMRSLDVRYWNGANLVELLAYSGMRLGEATSIVWGDVDFNEGRFTVTGGEQGTKNHEARAVPLFPALRDFLTRVRGSLTPDPKTRIIPIDRTSKGLDRACRAAGLPEFTHHCMRHYFVSNAIEAGIDFKTIAAWVGHKDGGLLVAKTYGHLRDSHSFEMAKRMTFSA